MSAQLEPASSAGSDSSGRAHGGLRRPLLELPGWLLVCAGILVTFLALGVLGDALGSGPSGPVSSSYATDARGLAAWAELLSRTGHTVVQLRTPLHQAQLDPGDTLIVLNPDALLPADGTRLLTFVRAGEAAIGGSESQSTLPAVIPRPPAWSSLGSSRQIAVAGWSYSSSRRPVGGGEPGHLRGGPVPVSPQGPEPVRQRHLLHRVGLRVPSPLGGQPQLVMQQARVSLHHGVPGSAGVDAEAGQISSSRPPRGTGRGVQVPGLGQAAPSNPGPSDHDVRVAVLYAMPLSGPPANHCIPAIQIPTGPGRAGSHSCRVTRGPGWLPSVGRKTREDQRWRNQTPCTCWPRPTERAQRGRGLPGCSRRCTTR